MALCPAPRLALAARGVGRDQGSWLDRVRALGAALVLACLLPAAPAASQDAAMSLSPASRGREGGDLLVRGAGLQPSTVYSIGLNSAGSARPDRVIGSAVSTADGDLLTTVSLPRGSAGSGVVTLRPATGDVLETPYVIVAGIPMQVTPTPPRAGQRVRVALSSIGATGDISLLYDGVRVLGPLPMQEANPTLALPLPTRWPASFPATVELQVVHSSGRSVLGRGWLDLQVDPPSDQPRLRPLSTELPATRPRPTERFSVSTNVEAEDNNPDDFIYTAWFQSDSGDTLPLGSGPLKSLVRKEGGKTFSNLSIEVFPASFLTQAFRRYVGQGGSSGSSTSGNVLLVAQPRDEVVAQGSTSAAKLGIHLGRIVREDYGQLGEDFEVRVIDRATELPIEGAFVSIKGLEYFASEPDPAAPGAGAQLQTEMARSGFANQLTASLPPSQTAAGTSAFNDPSQFAGCEFNAYRKLTEADGKAIFPVKYEDVERLFIFGEIAHCGEIVAGGVICRNADDQNKIQAPLAIQVSAAHLGYSPSNDPNVCGDFRHDMSFEFDDAAQSVQFIDVPSGIPRQLLTVRLFRNEAACGAAVGKHVVALDPGGNVSGSLVPLLPVQGATGDTTVYRSLPTAPNVQAVPDGIVQRRQTGWQARIEFDPFIAGASVVTAQLRFDSTGDGVLDYLTPMHRLPGTSTSCGQGGEEWGAAFPDFTRYGQGSRNAEIFLRDSKLRTTTRKLRLNFAPIPSWFDVRDPSLLPGSLVARLGSASTQGNLLASLQAIRPAQGASLTTGNLPANVGVLRTDSENDVALHQQLSYDGVGGIEQNVLSSNKVANNDGPDKTKGGTVSTGGSLDFGYSSPGVAFSETLIDTGRIPLFRMTWGIPPIADATLGADFWLKSQLQFYGTLRSTGDGRPQITNYVTPSLDLGVDLWFDLSAIAGLVSAKATASAASSLLMTATTVNNELVSTDECFAFALGANIKACAFGVCPFNESVCLVDSFTPSSCNFCVPQAGGAPPVFGMDPRCFNLPFSCAIPESKRKNLEQYGASLQPANSPPATVPPAIATDSAGTIIALVATASGVRALVSRGLEFGEPETFMIDQGRFPDSMAVEFLRPNAAIAVWSTSDRAPSGEGLEALRAAARTMRLRWSRWDGSSWSPAQDLTSASLGDGNVVLARCHGGVRLACSRGEVTAVWVRDRVGDFEQRRYSLMYATYTATGGGGGSWSAAQNVETRAINLTFDPTDMQPSLTYLRGFPTVFFVRSDARDVTSMSSRSIAYRIIGEGGVEAASGLPRGASWPSVTRDGSGGLVLAYTKRTDTQAFTGNRNALELARATCSAGTCSFDVETVADVHGRQLRGEAPKVRVDHSGQAVVTFRGMAFGPDANGRHIYPDDPVGMLTGVGSLIQVRSQLNAAPVTPVDLSADNQVHFQPQVAFDSATGTHLATSVGLNVINPAQAKAIRKDFPNAFSGRMKGLAIEENVQLYMLSDAHDLALSLPTPPPADTQLVAGGSLQLNVVLGNSGSGFDGIGATATRIVATWDQPFGVVEESGSVNVPAVATNALVDLAINVAMPTDALGDDRRTLFLTLVGPGAENDRFGGDNVIAVPIGGMPQPQNLRALTRVGGGGVALVWDDPQDPRIAGYQVFAETEDGQLVGIGSTPVAGFADLSLAPGGSRTYRVSSYSDRGFASPHSLPASATLVQEGPVFVDGFETRVE